MRKFELTNNHLLLLQNSKFIWNSENFGAACVDTSQPYKSEEFYLDMVKIIYDVDELDFEINEDKLNGLQQLHSETLQALRILVSGNYKPGTYVASDNVENWSLQVQKISYSIRKNILTHNCPVCWDYTSTAVGNPGLTCCICNSKFNILKFKKKTLKVEIVEIW